MNLFILLEFPRESDILLDLPPHQTRIIGLDTNKTILLLTTHIQTHYRNLYTQMYSIFKITYTVISAQI